MNVQLANIIHIIPTIYVESQGIDSITPKANRKVYTYLTMDSDFSQDSSIEAGGVVVTQSDKREISGMPAGEQQLLNGCEVVVILETTGGTKRVWGSPARPVRCTIQFGIPAVILSLNRKSPTPLLF